MTLGNEIRTRNERKLSVGVVRAGVGMMAEQWGLESVSRGSSLVSAETRGGLLTVRVLIQTRLPVICLRVVF